MIKIKKDGFFILMRIFINYINIMFSNLIKTDFLIQINKRASDKIKNKRQFKKIIHNHVTDYCKNKKIIICDIYETLGENKFFDKPVILLSDNAHKMSVKLTDYLFEKGYKQVKLYTEIYNKKLNIFWQGHKISTIYETKTYNGSIFNVIMKQNINNMLYMSKFNHLLELYYNIFDLTKSDNIKENIRLKDEILKKINWKKIETVGGNNNHKKYIKKIKNLKLIREHFINDFLAIENEKIIMLDEYGFDLLLGNKFNYDNKLTFISTVNFNIIYNLLVNFIKSLTNFKLSYKVENSDLPFDGRLKKYVIYICVPNEKTSKCNLKILFNIYNMCEYKVVPYYVIKGINIGTKNILLFYYNLNLWYLKKLLTNKKIKQNIYTHLSKEYINGLQNYLSKLKKKENNINKYKIYTKGTYYDEYIYYKYKFLNKPCKAYIPMLNKEIKDGTDETK